MHNKNSSIIKTVICNSISRTMRVYINSTLHIHKMKKKKKNWHFIVFHSRTAKCTSMQIYKTIYCKIFNIKNECLLVTSMTTYAQQSVTPTDFFVTHRNKHYIYFIYLIYSYRSINNFLGTNVNVLEDFFFFCSRDVNWAMITF